MALGARVRQAREARGLNQTELAEAINWTPQALSTLERRDSKKSERAGDLANFLRVNLSWLLNGSGKSGLEGVDEDDNEMVITGTLDSWDEHTPLLDDEVLVSLFDEVQFACGDELYNIEYQDTGKKTRFSKAKLDKAGVKAKNVVVAKAYGNSNYPLITDGATIAYDTSKATERLKEDKFYAMEVGGGLKIKTVRFLHDNNIEICTHNRDYPCITLTKKEFSETHRILGWVFWWENLEKW